MGKLTVPTSIAEMQEIMNTPAKAAEWIREGQFSEVVAAYQKATMPETATQVTDQLKAFFESEGLIEKHVDLAIKDTLGKLGVKGPNLGAPETPERGSGAKANASYNPLAHGVKMQELGFANLGDFAREAWFKNPRPSDRRERMRQVMNDFSSVEPSAGGFLIPESFRAEMMELVLEASIVRPRATVITMTSPTLSVPFVDAAGNDDGTVFGGIQFDWIGEGDTQDASVAKFGRAKLEARKLRGRADVPNELFADAAGLSSWLNQALPRGISFAEDAAFFNGTGAGQPLGILRSGARVKSSREVDSEISALDIANMYAQMLPSSLGRAVWVANQTTFPFLMTLHIGDASNGVALVNFVGGPTPTILGRPLILSEKVPALGGEGDIGFYDFGYYLVGDRQAVTVDTSEHARFVDDVTVMRILERVDGRPWLQNAFTPLNGDDVSPFVVLESDDDN
jgi:HK97 family phage major capsid protein